MTVTQSREARTPLEPRTLYRVAGPDAGPTVVSIAALHGNERAGIEAVQRVAQRVPAVGRGEWIALLGNRVATALGVRLVDRDLNRHWSNADRPEDAELVEDREQRELREALGTVIARARGAAYVIDLHTTSGRGKPFSVFADTLRCRAFAHALPLPMILGLDEHLDGTLVDYVAGLGHATCAIEGGPHDGQESPANLAAALHLVLEYTGLTRTDEGFEHAARAQLTDAVSDVPHVLEIRYRHPVEPDDGFRMHGGLASFDRVRAGQLLARDRRGEILSPRSGLLLMPLYQAQGEDGFFLTTTVWPGWLTLSRWLRLASGDRLVPFLPGVEPSGEDGLFTVDRRIARWGALGVVHLLGYRRERDEGRYLSIRRRKHDPL